MVKNGSNIEVWRGEIIIADSFSADGAPHGIAPRVYCAANPLRFTDPTGMVVDSLSQEQWANLKKDITQKREELLRSDKKDDKLRAESLTNTLNKMSHLESSSTVYSLIPKESVCVGKLILLDDNTISIQYTSFDTSQFIHELEHAYQFEIGEIVFDSEAIPCLIDIYDEIDAYKSQYAYAGILPGKSVSSINDISVSDLLTMKGKDGTLLYSNTFPYKVNTSIIYEKGILVGGKKYPPGTYMIKVLEDCLKSDNKYLIMKK